MNAQSRLLVCLSCARVEVRERNALFCFECAQQRAGEQSRAIGAIYRAVKRGDIPPASNFNCVDCGEKAFGYDHRDYTKPLSVDPVCPSCNKERGPALDSQMRDMPGVMCLEDMHQFNRLEA